MTKPEDRRSTPRIPYPGRAMVHLGKHHLTCETVDLGAGGVFVLSSVHARAGLEVVVELGLPRLGRIRLSGVIAREGQQGGRYGWGIAFVDTPTATRSLLRDFVLYELRARRENSRSAERSNKLRESLSEEILPELGEPRSDDGVYLHVRPARRKDGSDPHVDAPDDSLGVTAPTRSPSAIHRKSADKRRARASEPSTRAPSREAAAAPAARAEPRRSPSSAMHRSVKDRASSSSPAQRQRRRRRREPTADAPVAAPRGRTREDNAVYQRAQARAQARAASDPRISSSDEVSERVGEASSSARAPGEPSEAVREAQEFLEQLERGE